jgi:beta-lactam-binding protein with PASTA domain
MKLPYQDNKIGSLLKNIGILMGALMFLFIFYFYVYLPNATNHNKLITVPEFLGLDELELKQLADQTSLRFSIEDSAYSAEIPPYTALRQYPKAGTKVKENRLVYITINRVTPPSMPIPDLIDRSLINAEVVLKSNELVKGKVYYESSPFPTVTKMWYKGKMMTAGDRVPKGSVIDLVIGDGQGASDLVVGTLIGDSYGQAIFKLNGWNLHLGNVQIPAEVDTVGVRLFVYKQQPESGDSVRVGDPVSIWVGPKGYKPID